MRDTQVSSDDLELSWSTFRQQFEYFRSTEGSSENGLGVWSSSESEQANLRFMTDDADRTFLEIEVVVDVTTYRLEIALEVSRYLVHVSGRPS
jgi:hypothetical protein